MMGKRNGNYSYSGGFRVDLGERVLRVYEFREERLG